MITLPLAKSHLRILHDYDDQYIVSLIDAAIAAVGNFTSTDYESEPMPAPVVHACLLLIGSLYSTRQHVMEKSYIEVPLAYHYLLWPYRKVII